MEKLNCHCGQIEIEVNLTKGLEDLYRCNCSMCKRKGAISTVVDKKDLKVTKGEELLKFYQFNTNVAKHYFVLIAEYILTIKEEQILIHMV